MDKMISIGILKLRPANIYDSLLTYKWAMDIETRRNSIKIDEFSFEHHFHWFQDKLNDKACRIFILESLFPIGQIRFERKPNQWLVSYSIDDNLRNMGMGQQIIKMGLEVMGNGKYLARVKKDNIASIKIFHKLNFREIKNEFSNNDIISFLYEKA